MTQAVKDRQQLIKVLREAKKLYDRLYPKTTQPWQAFHLNTLIMNVEGDLRHQLHLESLERINSIRSQVEEEWPVGVVPPARTGSLKREDPKRRK